MGDQSHHHHRSLHQLKQPLLIPGVGADWPALELWQGPSGLKRLKHLVNDDSTTVQVMISHESSPGSFVGDLEELQLLETTFSSFLDGSLPSQLRTQPAKRKKPSPSPVHRFYLAQSPILAQDATSGDLTPGCLHGLLQDIRIPSRIMGTTPTSPLYQINFWANIHHPVRTSLHYDPSVNLLCLVQGKKIVRLLPPSATPHLEARPAYHESSNHAKKDLWTGISAEDVKMWREERGLVEITLERPGDAVLIPEGWWHQVESSANTMAVNFWWEGVQLMKEPSMKGYYFREMAHIICEQQREETLNAVCKAALNKRRQEMESYEYLNLSAFVDNMKHLFLAGNEEERGEEEEKSKENSACNELLLASFEVGVVFFMNVFLGLKDSCPSALGEYLIKAASPAVWEALTTGIEQEIAVGNGEVSDEELAYFYENIWNWSSGGEDMKHVLTSLMLKKKEEFAKEALRVALHRELGFDFSS